jgi:hypothetical protein
MNDMSHTVHSQLDPALSTQRNAQRHTAPHLSQLAKEYIELGEISPDPNP